MTRAMNAHVWFAARKGCCGLATYHGTHSSPVAGHLLVAELRNVVHVLLGIDTVQIAAHGKGLAQGI